MYLTLWLILCVGFIVYSSARWKLHPFLSLLIAAFAFGILSGMPLIQVVDSVNDGFGGTLGYIGIVIVCGTIIGVFLEKSGGAFTLAESVLRLTGRRNVPLAMSIVGYFVSIPVFSDSGFVILTPLNKALAKRAGITLASCAIALVLGLYATHTMVPPTPGPIAAAGILKADLGRVIGFGLLVSVAAVAVGWLYAVLVASRVYIDPEPDLSAEEIEDKIKTAPSAVKAFLPILVPIVLILLKSAASLPMKSYGTGFIRDILLFRPFGADTITVQASLQFIGSPVVALIIGVLLAFLLPGKLDSSMLSATGWIGQGLQNAAIIILITGAGGAFGKVLQNSKIADVLGETLKQLHLGIWVPFLISVAIKTAQGSSTVAIITTAGLISPLTASLGFDTSSEIALVVVMIGAGSMVISHVNDSLFWVVTQFSRMSVVQGYRLFSLGGALEGFAAGVVGWVLYLLVS